ncbi:MAG TPA: ATP-binding protein [Candidatus Didemnitutus sp.]|jgi:SpoVK/Ycf46/Vps4 family AAA+-type ATPase
MPGSPPLQNPLAAQVDRQAWASFAGYIYQIEQAMLRWINLRPDEALYLEGVEDCDVCSSQDQSAQAWQFKARADSVSLGRAEIIQTLNNFWEMVRANPAFRCELRYVTTSPMVIEQGAPFGDGIAGISLWKQAAADADSAGRIRAHLLGRADLSPELGAFLRTSALPLIQQEFFARITWNTSAPAREKLEAEIKRQLVHHGEAWSFLVPACDAAYPALFASACKACTRAHARRLTREDFLREFDGAAQVHRENALLKRQLLLASPTPRWNEVLSSESGRGQFSAIDRTDFLERVTVASQPLLAWPATLPSGQWLPRPEYDQLSATITTQASSTSLLLGEPGSGKSALLARLAEHCVQLPDTLVLALKADTLPQDVRTPDDLLPGWAGQGLARWLAVIARQQRVVIFVDQLDAVAEIMDRQTARLNVLLSLIGAAANQPGIHLVASCRPFEFKHDTRLQAIEDNQQVVLQPLAMEAVDQALAAAGHDAGRLTADCRRLLRNPWNLSVYLRHAQPGEEVRSLSVILGRVWNERIASQQAPAGTIDFLREVATRVREQEQLWLPAAISDRNPAAFRHLLSEEILVEGRDGLTFGFRHQSLFDYALLREFESAAISLSAYVWQRQGGLFVRPTLLAALRHLRTTAPRDYLRELTRLLRPPRGRSTRFHVRELLISFVGSQADPLPGEAALLLPLLRSHAEGPRVMRACAGSPGWFGRLAGDAGFQQWLKAPPDRAALALSCVSGGFTVAEDTAARLITRFWLPRPPCHTLILRAIWPRGAMGSPTLRLLKALAPAIAPDELGLVLTEVQRANPAVCAELLALNLAPAAAVATRLYRRSAAEGRKALGALLEKDLWSHWPVDDFAVEAPREFLGACWPIVAKILPLLTAAKNVHRRARYPDADPTMSYPERYGHGSGLMRPLMEGARALAANHPAEFLEFAERASRLEHMFAQRLVAAGFAHNVAPLQAPALAWLLAEPRRLSLGNYWEADDTIVLFHALAAAGEDATIRALETAALNYAVGAENFRGETEAQNQEYAARQTQRRRAQLLRALPRERLSAPAKQYLAQAESDLGELGINPPRGQGGFVGAPMPDTEMAVATDDAIMALIGTLPDSTGWEHPERRWHIEGVERSGGAIQQARALGAFVKSQPQRGLALARRLAPKTNELYAGELLGGLAQSTLPTPEVLDVFRDFCRREFSSPEFRVQAANALEILAKRGQGLPDDAIEAMLLRLDDFPLPEEKAGVEDSDARSSRTLLFGHVTWSVSDSSSRVMSAIVQGILQRPDAGKYARMLEILQRQTRQRRSNFFWGQALLESHPVFAHLPRPATALLRRLLRQQPGIVRLTPGRLALAHAVPFLQPSTAGRELVGVALSQRGAVNRQFAGELAFLVFGFHPTPAHRRMLRKPSGTGGEDYLRGLAAAAVHFFRCPETHDEARRLIGQALASRRKETVEAAFGFIRVLDVRALTSVEAGLVRRFLRLDLQQNRTWLPELIERVAAGCEAEPALAAEVCGYLLKTAEPELRDMRGGLSLRQEQLINIALTLHRLPTYRKRGLELFEWMLRLNLRELHDALKQLDQRETPGLSS